MKLWLERELNGRRADIKAAYLFGSSIQPDRSPRDVDLVIVTADCAGEPSWRRVVSFRNALREHFNETFQIPLSAMVVTPSEWEEIDGIIVRERVSVLIDE